MSATVLLMTSSTGGGHDMRASAFEAWARHPDTQANAIRTERLQVLEGAHPLYRFGVDLYNIIQKRAPWAHHLYFSYLEQAGMHTCADKLLGRERFIEVLEEKKPDVLLSTHAHLNHGYFELARSVLGRKRVRCMTYCGELFGGYGFCQYWANPLADRFFGAVRETCEAAARLGVSREVNRLGGFLMKPHFYEAPDSPEAIRAYVESELKLDPDRFILVLATGANGANNHLPCLEALWRSGLPVQVVALCGRNEQACERVQAWAARHEVMPVRALPYMDNMHRLMDAASAVFARPGTGTTSEAILRGCPIIFNGLGGVMPQEYITLKFARKKGIGSLVLRVGELPQSVYGLMRDDALGVQRQCMITARPNAHPTDIFNEISQRLP